MSVKGLARYNCGVFLLLALLASAITYHPDVQHLGDLLSAAFLGVSLLAGVASVVLGRLSPTLRLNPSWLLRAGLLTLAMAGTLLLALVVG
jgi:hypothetical protein